MKSLKDQQGFTIIEAIVSVVIVSLVVLPISLYFSNAARTAMESKKILKANQIAQSYVEQMKILAFSDIVHLLGNDYKNTFNYMTDPSLDNFEVEVELNTQLVDAEEEIYEIPPTINYDDIMWDYIIELDKVKTNEVIIKDGDDNLLEVSTDESYGIDHEREISIDYHYDGTIKIRHKKMGSYLPINLPQPPEKFYNIKVLCKGKEIELDESGNVKVGESLDTTLYIQNFSDRPVSIYTFEVENSLVQTPHIIALEGHIIRRFDFEPKDINTHRLYTIHVKVTHKGEEYATISATRLGD
jgi:type II secretory pathway pseudopilin PulG